MLDLTRHRCIFNADGNTWFYPYRRASLFYRSPGEPVSPEYIDRCIQILAEHGVDTLMMHSSDKLAYYPSRRMPTFWQGYTRGDASHFFGHVLGCEMTEKQIEEYLTESVQMMDSYLDLAEAGIDWLAETAAACRRHGIVPWLSVRMNDMHGATKYPSASYQNPPIFKDSHNRLRGTTYNREAPLSTAWQGLNYELPQVREFMRAMIADAVENYDYEGLELDWSRWPLCCEPEAAEDIIELITEWHGELRKLTQNIAKQRGISYPLGIKYVGALEQLRTIGLDMLEIARRGYVDWLAPSNSWQTSWDIPCDEVKLLVGDDTAVLGVLELGPNWLHGYLPAQTTGNPNLGSEIPINYRLLYASPPFIRGNAVSKLVLGVDALEVFNMPPCDQWHHWPWDDGCKAEYSALRDLASLDALRGQPKWYTFSSQSGHYSHELFETVGPFPLTLNAGERRECRLPMCAEEPAGGLELIIQIVVDVDKAGLPLGIYLNGCWPNFAPQASRSLLFPIASMTELIPRHMGLTYALPLSLLHDGWNTITLMNGTPWAYGTDQSAAAIQVHSVEVAVRPETRELV